METEEQSLIAHLLEIEEQAAELLAEGHLENDRVLAEARARADADYNEKYKEIASKLEYEYNKKIESFDAEHKAVIDSYKEKISKTQKDVASFETFLQKVL